MNPRQSPAEHFTTGQFQPTAIQFSSTGLTQVNDQSLQVLRAGALRQQLPEQISQTRAQLRI
jgi:hypothetical protein